MATVIIGMYGAIAGGSEDAIANIDVPQDGVITGIDWDGRLNLDADNEVSDIELSFIATSQQSQNDVRGRISSISCNISLTTSGIAAPVLQKFVGPLDLGVAAGERIYLHANSTAGVTGAVRCNVHLDVGRAAARRSARR